MSKLRKAVIVWTARDYASERPTVCYTSRLAHDDYILDCRGYESARGQANVADKAAAGKYTLLIRGDRQLWEGNGDSLMVSMYDAGWEGPRPPVLDIRAQDASPNMNRFADLHSALWKLDLERVGTVTYSEEPGGDLHIVSARATNAAGKESVFRWHLDPRRGWSPIRMEFIREGVLLMETRIAVKDYSGVWFPASIARFRKTWRDGKSPFHLITVESVRTTGELPDALGPAEIGVEIGTNVKVMSNRTPAGASEVRIWDGKEPGESKEVWRKVKRGELKRGPNFVRNSQQASSRPSVEESGGFTESARSRWQAYVTRYAEEHHFSESQRRSAQGVLSDCLKKVEAVLTTNKRDVEEYQRISSETRTGSLGKQKSDRLEALRLRLQGLLDKVFEDELRPRLAAIATASQR